MAAGKPKGAKRPPPKSKSNAAKRRASGSSANRNRPAAQRSRQDRERQALRNRLIAGAVVLVIIGALVFSAARPKSSTSPSVGALDAGAGNCTLDSKSDEIAPAGRHIPNPSYKVEPPAGGSHLQSAAEPGFYRAGQSPSDGQLVHAMEHGFVVLWYRSDLAAATLDQIEVLSDRLGRELIVAPRPNLKGEVAVTSWHKRLLCQELVPEKVEEFSRKYKDKGPEKGFL